MWPYVVAGLAALASAAGACYFYLRARADRAERDTALGQAAAATDLASRLDASLKALAATEDRAREQDEARGEAAKASPAQAATFLRDSVVGGVHGVVLPAGAADPAQGGVPAAGVPGRSQG